MSQDLSAVIPQLLAQGLMALRQKAFMPQIVNRAYDPIAGNKGSTIDVPIPSAVSVNDVTPAITAPAGTDLLPTQVAITLDKWKEAGFTLTDKDELEVMAGTFPMQASEAIKAIANQINDDIFTAGVNGFFGYAGTAGTTPFASDLTAATALDRVLNTQLAPEEDRRVVLDPFAKANALGLRAFQDQSWRTNASGIVEGALSRTLGFDWYMHQRTPSFTKGTGTGYLVDHVSGAYPIGTTTVVIDTGTNTFKVGDIFTFSGHSQSYVSETAGTTGMVSLSFKPGLVATVANNEAITIVNTTGVQNLAFHRDAIAFATRPLAGSSQGLGNQIMSTVDPLSGLTLRLEVMRQWKQVRYSFDVLYGCKVVRGELGARLLG